MEKLHLIVRGRVQGVSFRSTTVRVAERLGISGWVRNLPDGSVEVVAGGDEGKINEFLEYLKKGPQLADVRCMEVSTYDKEIEKGFRRLD